MPFTFDQGNQSIEIRSQTAVPTSQGLANSTTELESAASLISSTIFLNSKWNTNFSSSLAFSLFQYSHLSSQAAIDSLQRGNTVIKPSSSSGLFVYQFSGGELTSSFTYLITPKYDWQWGGTFVKNNTAPKNQNQGYFYSLAPGIKLNSEYTIRAILEKYHVQSDAVPAIFSDSNLGRTNRDGQRYGISLLTSQYLLQLFGANSKLITPNPFQSADTSIFLNLEIHNIAL